MNSSWTAHQRTDAALPVPASAAVQRGTSVQLNLRVASPILCEAGGLFFSLFESDKSPPKLAHSLCAPVPTRLEASSYYCKRKEERYEAPWMGAVL